MRDRGGEVEGWKGIERKSIERVGGSEGQRERDAKVEERKRGRQ